DVAPGILKEILEWAGRTRTVLLAFVRNPGTFEVLASLGQMNAEEREAFRTKLDGTAVGPFVLVNLGPVAPEQLPHTVRERLLARLPAAASPQEIRAGTTEPDGPGRVRSAVEEKASDTAGAASVSPAA
ncbi:MAG: hypothetical protein Q8R32_02095, partial [bacterium]|nr:hypothetical protein [bacterium]